MLDYIIVGQGIAGSVLALELLSKGLNIKVIDNSHYKSSSKIAAGLVHPMSFKRTILSWNAELLSEHSIKYYKEKETELKASFFEPLTFLRLFGSIEEQNNWFAKQSSPPFDKVLLDFNEDLSNYSLKNNFGVGKVNWSFRLKLPVFLDAVKNRLIDEGKLLNEKIDYSLIKHSDESIVYGELKAKGIIFCEGHQYSNNPYLNYIPENSTKGELLKIIVNGLPNYSLSKNCFVLPLEKDKYILGATYDWKDKSYEITEEAKEELLEKFSNISDGKVEVIEHWTGIRPTTLDRKPILGTHPTHKNIYIFNGLGSKGVQFAPYYANRLVNYLTEGLEIEKEINLERFTKKYFLK